ncbi:MAG: hypothetical protein P8L18_10060 [Verrucomicrobiota bacterium]|nr:hypothetical protein [Verrucomicrobiota bacterium]
MEEATRSLNLKLKLESFHMEHVGFFKRLVAMIIDGFTVMFLAIVTILAMSFLVSCGKPSSAPRSSDSSESNGFAMADLDRTIGNWAADGAFISIRKTQGDASNLVIELTLLDLEELTMVSKRFYHFLELPDKGTKETFGIDKKNGILIGSITPLDNGIRIEEKPLAKGMDSFPVEVSEWIFNDNLSQLSLSWQIGSKSIFHFEKVAKNESQFLHDLDIQVSRKVEIDPAYDALFEQFLGNWTGKTTKSWPTGTRVDVTFEAHPSARMLLERWSFTDPTGEVLLENTNYTFLGPLFEKTFGRPFGLANSSGMVGYWQVNQSGELMQFEGSDARITRKLIGDDQFVGIWQLKSETGIWRNGHYNIEMKRVSK